MTYILAILVVRLCLQSIGQWRCQTILAAWRTAKCDTITISFDAAISDATWAAVGAAIAVAGSVVFPKVFLLLGL
jgi:hypothetical protein